MSEQNNPIYEFGPFRLETARRRLTREGAVIALTRKGYETLLVLVQGSGQIIEKERLLKEIWPDTFVEEGSLAVNISALRKALGEDKNDPNYIETVPRVGYRFVAEVRVLEMGQNQDREPIEKAQPTSTVPVPSIEESEREVASASSLIPEAREVRDGLVPPKSRRPVLLISLTAFALVIIVAFIFYLRSIRKPTERVDSIAVIPLVNEGSDPNTEYLSDGITEDIINSLSRLPNLKVIARTTMFRYKGRQTDPQAVGRELNVSAVLTGRVLQQDDTLSIQVELIEVSSGRQIWGERLARKRSDIVATQIDVSNHLSESLVERVTGEDRKRLTNRYQNNPKAYLLYLRGRYFWNKRDAKSLQKSIEYFQEAIREDASYALAYSGMADCYSLLSLYSIGSRRANFDEAKAAANRALEIDPNLSEAHTSLALVLASYEWDWDGADREYKRSIELNPSYVTAHHWYGIYLAEMGRFDEAVAEETRALDLDPLSIPVNADMGRVLFYARRYEDSLAQYKRTIELDPNYDAFYIDMSNLYEELGMYDEWYELVEKHAPVIKDSYNPSADLFKVYWKEKIHQEKEAHYTAAEVYTRFGDKDRAFEALNRAFDDKDHRMTQLKVNPVLDPLRSDQRFTDLLRKMNFLR